ncbi:MAG: hypothetical protein QM736_27635 [Vicinamibacterales bacterium]
MMDSVTRFAMAQREVGLAAGEPPTAKGYPPSVFALLPDSSSARATCAAAAASRPCTRSSWKGTTTTNRSPMPFAAFSTATSSSSRDLAARNHYPAIDILQSISRTMPDVTSAAHRAKAGKVREWLATLRDSERPGQRRRVRRGQQPSHRRSAREARCG